MSSPKIAAAVLALVAAAVVGATAAQPAPARAASPPIRIDVGGGGTGGWQADTSSSPSRYVTAGETRIATSDQEIDVSHPSIPGGTPESLFATERWATRSQAMHWDFPVTTGAYQVRLYFAETFPGTQAAGARVFDVAIEGATVLDDFDIFATAGGYRAVMRSFTVESDANLDVDLTRVAQNPALKAIEVEPSGSGTGSAPAPPPPPDPKPTPDPGPKPAPNPPQVPDPPAPAPGPRPDPPSGSCNGVDVRPGDNLVQLVNGTSGKTFCVHAGTHNIGNAILQPGSGDKLIGDPVRVEAPGLVHASTKIVGHGTAVIELGSSSGVLLQNLDVSGATGSKSDTNAETKKHGRGIRGGDNVTIRYVASHDNAASGISSLGDGALIEHVELYKNGSDSFLGCCAGGVKSANSYTIRNSYVHDNIGVGIWQDVDGTDFVVTDNVVTNNSRSGIRYEHNQNVAGSAAILRNVVRGNNIEQRAGDAGGIIVNSAPNAEIAFNTLSGNHSAGIQVGGSRGSTAGTNIHDNVISDSLKGCDAGGVSCRTNSTSGGAASSTSTKRLKRK